MSGFYEARGIGGGITTDGKRGGCMMTRKWEVLLVLPEDHAG